MHKIRQFFSRLAEQTKEAFSTYPISMLLIVAAFAMMQYSTWATLWESNYELNDLLQRLSTTIWITLPLFTAVPFFRMRQWTYFLALGFGIGFFLLQGDDFWTLEASLRTALWALAFYSVAFFLPVWKRDSNLAFWAYVEKLTFVVALGLVCTGVLVASLELALFSIRELFEVSLDYRWEETVAMGGFLLFLPIFIHVGLPYDWKKFATEHDFPAFFKPLAYYLLLPIAFLYIGILTVYVAQILITWEWPDGQVAYPVLYLSALIFATYFVSYPWGKPWLRYGFLILIPFLAIYFAAMAIRISEYGLTENRYLGVLLGMILLGLSIYYWLSKEKRFQMSFLVVSIAALFSGFGPWSAFEISIGNQVNRLESKLIEIGALQDGKLIEADSSLLDDKTEGEISNIVDYLVARGRLTEVQEWTDLDLSGDTLSYDTDLRSAFMEEMGLEYSYYYAFEDKTLDDYSATYGEAVDVEGYDVLFPLDMSFDAYYEATPFSYNWNSEQDNLSAELMEDGSILITYEGSELTLDLMALKASIDAADIDRYSLDPDVLSASAEDSKFRVKIYIENMSFNYTDDERAELESAYVWGKLLIDAK